MRLAGPLIGLVSIVGLAAANTRQVLGRWDSTEPRSRPVLSKHLATRFRGVFTSRSRSYQASVARGAANEGEAPLGSSDLQVLANDSYVRSFIPLR